MAFGQAVRRGTVGAVAADRAVVVTHSLCGRAHPASAEHSDNVDARGGGVGVVNRMGAFSAPAPAGYSRAAAPRWLQ
eukprot:363353-Chlamydomonas_euryale.AAC.22